jgi:hypothetical protein
MDPGKRDMLRATATLGDRRDEAFLDQDGRVVQVKRLGSPFAH